MGQEVRRVVPAMRAVFVIGSFLVAAAGFQLFVLSDHTDRFFAWPIQPGLSAAFLGAFYLMALVVGIQSAKEEVWARARVGVYGVALFVVLTLLATLLHLDKFHFDADGFVPVFAAWAWLVVYVIAPIGVPTAIVFQHRAPGGDPPRTAPLSAWYRAIVGLQGIVFLVVGATFWLAPTSTTWWPWELTPLVARGMGSWLLGLSVVMATAVWENDYARIRVATLAYAILGVLQLVALLRYADDLRGGAATAIYVAFVLVAVFTGAIGEARARSAASPVESPSPRSS